MNDTFTQTTRTSWSSRIGKSLMGMLFGIAFVIIGIGLLFWNEGRAIKTHRALIESQGLVISINAAEYAPSMDGKLVHITGKAITEQILEDNLLAININALKLQRHVETYQWQETSHTEERKITGGDSETTTTYQYSKTWSSEKINSSKFKKIAGHENPEAWHYTNETWTADDISIGNYRLSTIHKDLIENFQQLSLTENFSMPKELKKFNNILYNGENPQKPNIGDQRIQFNFVPSQIYSAVGDINNYELHDHIASNGRTIALLQAGSHTANAMFEKAKTDNETLTWILRLVGSLLLVAAFMMILKPLSVLADVVPIIGNIVAAGTGIISILLGSIVALVTICIAWIFYRPLLGFALLVIIGALIYGLKRKSAQGAKVIAQKNAIEPSAP